MKKKFLCAFTCLWLVLTLTSAQNVPVKKPAAALPVATPLAAALPNAAELSSPMTWQIFYQVLIGELSAGAGDPAPAVSLMLDAARKTNDAQLFQRATDLALQSRSGDAALQVARAWKQALPGSLEASRYTLQILLALNRVSESAEALKSLIELTPAPEREQALATVPRLYARASDKKLAAATAEQALTPYLSAPGTAAPAWATLARLRLAAGDKAGALEATRRGHTAAPQAPAPAVVALELMEVQLPQAEAIVRQYLASASTVQPEFRMGYVRNLLEAQRYPEALAQLQIVTRDEPEFMQGWLVLGSLQLQDDALAPAEASFKRYVGLAERLNPGEERSRGLAQAFLALAQIAEKRKDFAGADAWLNRIDNPELLMQAQSRRAVLLGRQGKLDEGLALIRALPERSGSDARGKLLAEVALLKEFKQYKAAYATLGRAVAASPDEIELLYEQAMLAEKLDLLTEMERLLRRVIELKPDYHAAYNALGYSLADRNVRLTEAKQLIQKALALVPADPFIQDSLGWVEFRLGNRAEARQILEAAYKARPDAEIAAHLGEVLWSLGQHERAQAVWKEGRLLNADNETLQDTLKRLRAKP